MARRTGHTSLVDGEVSPVLGEPESHELPATSADRSSPWQTRLPSVVRAHPSVAVFFALLGMAIVSTAVHRILVGWVHGPLVFVDELGYERMALSLAKTGHLTLFGNK